MKFVADDTDAKLLGYGLGGISILIIILSVELFNGPPPEHSTLNLFTGQIVGAQFSKSRERIYAEIQVKNGPKDMILFQQVPQQMASKIEQFPSGSGVSALIFGKQFTDRRTGLPRHAMWQLSVGERKVFSYDEILQFHANQDARWRILGYCFAVAGVICLVAIAIRRLRRAAP